MMFSIIMIVLYVVIMIHNASIANIYYHNMPILIHKYTYIYIYRFYMVLHSIFRFNLFFHAHNTNAPRLDGGHDAAEHPSHPSDLEVHGAQDRLDHRPQLIMVNLWFG